MCVVATLAIHVLALCVVEYVGLLTNMVEVDKDEQTAYLCEPINYRTGKYFLKIISYQLHYRICRFE